MRRPPFITFMTFNRLGNTIPSLASLLEKDEDFDLYLLDNYSQDNTWEYLNSINDPRIKSKFRSDKNISFSLLNKALLERDQDQDYINIEYDVTICTSNFIQIFQDIFTEDKSIGSLSGSREDLICKLSKSITVGEYSIYPSPILGFCMAIPYEVMNKLGYFNEMSFGADIDFNKRIDKVLNKTSGYCENILCKVANIPLCEDCSIFGSLCKGDKICTKFYNSCHGEFYKRFAAQIHNRIAEHVAQNRIFCDTIHNPECSLTSEEQQIAINNINWIASNYQQFLNKMK